jgi:hypothetical protein
VGCAIPVQPVQRFDDVHRQADRAPVVGDGAADRLANPPRRVGRKLEAAPELKAIDGLHQADVAFLNQVEERQPAPRVAFRDRHDQPQIGFEQFAFRFGDAGLVVAHQPQTLAEAAGWQAGSTLETTASCRACGRRSDARDVFELVFEPRQLLDQVVDNRWANRQVAKNRRDRGFGSTDLPAKPVA